jgi:HAMP domain-containing protein
MARESETAAPKFRRRRVLVQPGYQLRVAATVLVCILGYSLLLGFLVFYPLQQEYQAATNPEQQLWLARQVLELHARFWPGVLVVALLVAVQSMFVTHRIVGPAYHLRRVLDQLASGRVEVRAHLRRWDRLKDLELATNGLAEELERAAAERGRERERLLAALAAVRPALADPAVPAPVRQGIRELDRLLDAPAEAR